MKDFLMLILVIAGLIFFILMGYWHVNIWNECRVDHSWFYCAKLISK